MSKIIYKPILFSTSMVQAILEGKKTQTRRIVKFPNNWDGKTVYPNGNLGLKYGVLENNELLLFRLFPKFEIGTILWVPIFMPKEAAMLFLKVTDIRVERLHDISENDAIKEGIKEMNGIYYDYLSEEFYRKPYESFCTLWARVNGKESWKKNPFVWVYEFEIIDI